MQSVKHKILDLKKNVTWLRRLILFELAENCRKKDQAVYCSGGNNLQYCKIPNLYGFRKVLHLFCAMCKVLEEETQFILIPFSPFRTKSALSSHNILVKGHCGNQTEFNFCSILCTVHWGPVLAPCLVVCISLLLKEVHLQSWQNILLFLVESLPQLNLSLTISFCN